MNEILVVNKSKNMTSRDVINILNKKFSTKKIGHTGTLDPIATGVLVICIGRFTKLVDIITSLDKEYIAEIKLGIKTDTGDITGNIIDKKDYNINEKQIKEVFKSFIGTLEQTPPIYSAIKVKGKKLYEYARNNENVDIPKRVVEIKSLKLLEYKEDTIKFKSEVSKGTYIRSLIESICEKLNTVGTMNNLIRTRQGKFSIEDSYTLEDIKNDNYKFIDINKILEYPVVNISDNQYNKVINGNKIILDIEDEKIILKYQNELVAIYEKFENVYRPFIMLKIK